MGVIVGELRWATGDFPAVTEQGRGDKLRRAGAVEALNARP